MSQIEGVRVKSLTVHADDRGVLYEALRCDDPEFVQFGQTNFTWSYPGMIKAFHWHERQTDYWVCPVGALQVVLFDLRGLPVPRGWVEVLEPETREARTQVVYLHESRPQLLTIPPGVAHGYRVLSEKSALLVYHVTHAYDPENPDERRLAWNDPVIGFDWKTQFR